MRRKKKNRNNPYILEEGGVQEDCQRIGSLLNQSETVKIDERVERTIINESDDSFGK